MFCFRSIRIPQERQRCHGMLMLIAVVLVGILSWAYQAIQPPPPNKCGSLNGPPVTASRIKLSDGRHLAYLERGVPKGMAKYKLIVVHGFSGSREMILPLSKELIQELGIYILSFDRAGYGESDPNPERSVKSDALDIQELADQLKIGSKFHILGVSMGGYSIWGCLKYIPHRLAGASLVVPIINYWWPSFPRDLSREAYKLQLVQDQWALRIAHYTPQLLYSWMTQKWFPCSSVVTKNPAAYSRLDLEIIQKAAANGMPKEDKVLQQGEFESRHRDMIVSFGSWEFDPMDLDNPFPNNEGSVDLWHGFEDRLVPVLLQRYVSERLPWIKYHEVPESGHLLLYLPGYCDAIVRALLLGEGSCLS